MFDYGAALTPSYMNRVVWVLGLKYEITHCSEMCTFPGKNPILDTTNLH